MEEDLYKHSEQYAALPYYVKAADITNRNKERILAYKNNCRGRGLTKCRVVKVIHTLCMLAKGFGKDFDTVTKADVEAYFAALEERGKLGEEGQRIGELSPWTKHTYKSVFKSFFRWIKGTEEYPPEVKWLVCSVKDREQKLYSEKDFLTSLEAKLLVNKAVHPRDKAFASLLLESGCRIGELGNLKIADIQFDTYGVILKVNGKSGRRNVRIVKSAGYLRDWLNCHPSRFNADSPFWVNLEVGRRTAMSYIGFRALLKRLFKRAGISEKKCNPHSFRHRRATELSSKMTEFQMCSYFGWTMGSEMPRTYVHISGKDMDDAVLELNGLKKAEKQNEFGEPITCPRCRTVNPHENLICFNCNLVFKEQEEIIKENKLTTEVTRKIFSDPKVWAVVEQLIEKDAELKSSLQKIGC